jgi:alpha-tubulin suppressor-like RCC1 family protein
MRFTKRLLDRRSSAALLAVTCLATVAAAASCSSSDDTETREPDASADSGLETSAAEASTPPNDAAADAPRERPPFDGGALPVVCASSPCATALVTTFGAHEGDRAEGYCALLDNGSVACWGANAVGQLGRGADAGTADSPWPARVVGLPTVVRLDHTCAVDAERGVWCWGQGPFLRNDAGEATLERTPVKLPLPPVKDMGIGFVVGCAGLDDGVLCWGNNRYTQVNPTREFRAVPPNLVALPSGASIGDVLVGNATVVLQENGEIVTWGANPPLARVSSRDPDPVPTPTALGAVSSIDVTNNTACATTGGTGYCWGALDVFGNQEAPSALTRSMPEPVVAPEPLVQIATTRVFSFTDTSGNRVVQTQRWCAVGVSGDVYCWGLNTSGQAGDGTKDHAFEAVKVGGLPGPAAEVKTMAMSTCALLTSGKVHCWGNNFYGQLGHGEAKGMSLVPQEVVLP